MVDDVLACLPVSRMCTPWREPQHLNFVSPSPCTALPPDEHTRAVLGALQQASDTAVAVKEAVVEATLQQQQEMMEVVDKVAAAAPPPPPPLRSPLLQMSTQT